MWRHQRAERSSAASFQADSREIMQYLQEGNLIFVCVPINNPSRSGDGTGRGVAWRGGDAAAAATASCCVQLNSVNSGWEIRSTAHSVSQTPQRFGSSHRGRTPLEIHTALRLFAPPAAAARTPTAQSSLLISGPYGGTKLYVRNPAL